MALTRKPDAPLSRPCQAAEDGAATQAPPAAARPRTPARAAGGLEELLRDEEGEDDIVDPAFFDDLRRMPVVECSLEAWRFAPIRFPMPYTACSNVAATFSVPAEQAQALLPESRRFALVRTRPGHSAISVFAFDFRRGALGPYRELGVAVPVVLDGTRTPPLLPLLLEHRYPGFGMHIVELPVTSARPCECGIAVCGLPKIVGAADYVAQGARGRCTMTAGERLLADLQVDAGRAKARPPRRYARTVTAIQVLHARVVCTTFVSVGEGYRRLRGGQASLTIGDHPRVARLKGLSLGTRPIEVMVQPRFNWIISAPMDRGPAFD